MDQDSNHAAEQDLARVCVWGVNEKAAELLVRRLSKSDMSTGCKLPLVLLIIEATVMMSTGVERDEGESGWGGVGWGEGGDD